MAVDLNSIGAPLKPYLVSLALGLLVGIIYALFQVRSPAPPVIALVGLLGILLGEQIPPLIRQVWQPQAGQVSWFGGQVTPHVFGHLPAARKPAAEPIAATRPRSDRDSSG